MDGIAQELARKYPTTSAGWSITVRSLQRFYSSVRNIRQTLWVLLAAVGFLLLIACANVGNLFLARGTVRRKEIALRLALGAARPRLIRQLMTESLLLGLSGGVAGLLLARLVFKLMIAMVVSAERHPERQRRVGLRDGYVGRRHRSVRARARFAGIATRSEWFSS